MRLLAEALHTHGLIYELANQGTAILLPTYDMPEMIGVADRVLVIFDYENKRKIEHDRNYDQVSKQIMGFIRGREAA